MARLTERALGGRHSSQGGPAGGDDAGAAVYLLLASILLSSFINRLMLAGLEVRPMLSAHAMAMEPAAACVVIQMKAWSGDNGNFEVTR